MFLRILLRSALVRPKRSLTALLAVTVAAGVATTMLILYSGVQAKLHRQFRSYGTNIVLTAQAGAALPVNALSEVDRLIGSDSVAAPFAFAVAQTENGDPVVVAATDFDRVRRLNSWWSVTAWPSSSGAALIGSRVPVLQGAQGFDLTYAGRSVHFRSAGQLHAGGEDDRRAYIALRDLTSWTGLQADTIQIAASGDSQQLEALVARLSAAFPQARVRPVRQILEAEGRVYEKTRSTLLATVAVIILTAMLCVFATLTASLLERRRDFALMKALGAGELMTNGIFGLEAASLGVVGSIIGYAVGLGLAEMISRNDFQESISPQLKVFPEILLGCLALTLLAALLPLTFLKHVQPASVLKGE